MEDLRVLSCLERNGNLREWRTVGLGCQSIVGVYYRGQPVDRVDRILEEVE